MRSVLLPVAAFVTVVGCSHASTTHAPSSGPEVATRDEAMARRAELGPLDEPLGDPEAEIRRLRGFLAEPSVEGQLRYEVRSRLDAVHAAALSDASVDHGAALARFREDVPLLLAIEGTTGSDDWIAAHLEPLVVQDPELFLHSPDAVTRALSAIDERHLAIDRGDPADPRDEALRRFATTLPPTLRARAAAVGLVRDLSVFDDASIAVLGEAEWSTILALLDHALDAGALERAKLVAERLVAVEPTVIEPRIVLAALSRGLPVHLRMYRTGPRDVRDLVRLAFELRWDEADHPVERLEITRLGVVDRADARRLLVPIAASGDEDVRVLARDYLAAFDAPSPSTDAEAERRREAHAAELQEREACRDVYARPWNAPTRCLTDDVIDHVLGRLTAVPLPSARRALAWLESLDSTDLRFRPKYVELRIDLAIANGDLDLADRFLAERGRLLPAGSRVLLRLRILDARRSDDATERREDADAIVDTVAWNGLENAFRRAWQAMSSSHCGLPSYMQEPERATESVEITFASDVTEPSDASIARLENVTTLVDRFDVPYVYALALATAARAGDFERVRSLERRIHALAPDSFVDLLSAFTRALADRDLAAAEEILRRVRLVAPGTDWPEAIDDPLRDLRPNGRADSPDNEGCEGCDEAYEEESGALARRLAAFGASELDTLLAHEILDESDEYVSTATEEARVDRFLGGNPRGAAALAIRCYVGSTLYGADGRFRDPDDDLRTDPDRPSRRATVARRAVDVCARAVAQRADDELLVSWARAMLAVDTLDGDAGRVFLRATESSTLPNVLIARVRVLRDVGRPTSEVFGAMQRYLSLHSLDDLRRWTSAFGIPTLTPELNVAAIYFGFVGAEGELYRGEYDRVLARGRDDSFWSFLAADAAAHRIDDAGVREFVASGGGTSYGRHRWNGRSAKAFLDRHPDSLAAQLLVLQFVATRAQDVCPSREICLALTNTVLTTSNRPAVVALVARARLGLGDRDGARSAVVQALAVYPDDETLRTVLEEDCR